MERPNNAIAKFHNNISEARYKLNLNEQRLYIYAVKMIDQDRPDFETVEFTIKDLAKATGMGEKSLYRDIKDMARNILSTVIEAKHPDGGWEMFQMASYCKHIPDTGYIRFEFHEVMKPFLLELKQHYFIQAPQVIKFKSTHAIKLYDFIEAMTYNKSEYEIEIDEFKMLMGCEGKYPRWNTFREKVIMPSVEEINSKTDLDLSFELIKRGRSAHSIRFEFTKQQVVDHKAKEEYIKIFMSAKDIQKLRVDCGLVNENFTDVELVELYEIAVHKTENNIDFDVYEYMRENYSYMCEKLDGVSSKTRRHGYFKTALENGYGLDLNQIKFF